VVHADPATAGSGLATGGAGRARYVNIAVKAAFAVLLIMVALGHDWPQLQGKAVGLRLVFYPLSALVVPVTWWLRGRRGRYPHDVDALLVAPFAIDLAGNLLNLFDSVSWWDDANHLVNWALLVAAVGRLLRRTTLAQLVRIGLATGFGAVAAILWELGEYVTFVQHSTERFTAYRDTMGDEALGLTGSVVGAWLSSLGPRA
jgi:hypothetical protein